MDDRKKVAHHEAAHAVVAHSVGAGIVEGGIDIDAPSSVEGAYGRTAVNIFAHEESLTETQQKESVIHSLAIICAGAASDARLLNRPLDEALAAQSADASEAKKFLADNPLVETPEEAEFLLKEAMRYTAKILDRPEIWSAIELVAEECIKNDGKLSKAQIEGLLAKALPK